jgi:hypothetical protein
MGGSWTLSSRTGKNLRIVTASMGGTGPRPGGINGRIASGSAFPFNAINCPLGRARGFGGAILLDLLGPPGRCSGCWPHDGAVAGGADFHFDDIPVRGDDGARAIGANDDEAAA